MNILPPTMHEAWEKRFCGGTLSWSPALLALSLPSYSGSGLDRTKSGLEMLMGVGEVTTIHLALRNSEAGSAERQACVNGISRLPSSASVDASFC